MNREQEKGVVLIELSIALPLLLVLLMGLTHICQVIDSAFTLQLLAREIANDIDRNCTGQESGEATQSCIDERLNHLSPDSITKFAVTVLPQIKIAVSVYSRDGSIQRDALWSFNGSDDGVEFTGKFGNNLARVENEITALDGINQQVVITELLLDKTGVFGTLFIPYGGLRATSIF